MSVRVGVAGLGHWGPNLARNFAEIAELAWLCDSEPERRDIASRYTQAKFTSSFDEMLEDPDLDAVVVATPVPTHFELARRTLEAGKHVLVEKPPAMKGHEMDELVALASERDLVLMPGHLLLYHPGVRRVKDMIAAGELGDVLCVYGNRQNLGIIRSNENALWSLGVHDLSVILYLLDEDPERGECVRSRLPDERRRGRRVLLPPLPVGEDRAHASLLARSAQDAEDHRRRVRRRWSSSTTWSSSGR